MLQLEEINFANIWGWEIKSFLPGIMDSAKKWIKKFGIEFMGIGRVEIDLANMEKMGISEE